MTIPIVPGPFSFLDTLGKGIAAYGTGREDYRQRQRKESQEDRAEALKQVGTIFDAVQRNELTTSALKSPFFLNMLKRSGIAESFSPENVAAKPEEQVREAQSGYLSSVLGPQGDPTERAQVLAAGRPVSRSEAATERAGAAVGGLKAAAVEGPLTPTQTSALTGVPTPATAEAADQTAQNPELGGIAKRSVRDLYTRLGRIPTIDEVKAHVQTDLRAKPFKNELTDPFLGNAIRDLQAELAEEETKRIAAETRRDAASQNVVKDITSQQGELRQRMTARQQENENLRKSLSPFATIPGADMSKLSEQDRQNLAKIQANEAANAKDQETLTGLNQQAQQVIAPRVTKSGGAPEGTLAERRNEWDRRAKAIKDHPNDPRVKGKKVEDLIGARP